MSTIGGPVTRLNYDYTVTPTMLLHVGVGYQQNTFLYDTPDTHYDSRTQLGLVGATIVRNLPVFQGLCTLTGGCPTAAGSEMNMGPVASQHHDYWKKPTANASITWIHGSHSYSAGTDIYWSAVP